MTGLRRRTCLQAAAALPLLRMPAARAEDVQRQLRFTLSLSNPSADELRDAFVWLYLPAGTTPSQQLVSVSASMAHQRRSDALGHELAGFEFARMPPYANRVLSVSMHVRLRPQPAPSALADPGSWLAAERHIESDDAAMRAAAQPLRRASPMDTAQAIYDWVRGHLRYDAYTADVRGARHALAERRGDCTEYACLATALARACGIPARLVGGYVADRDSVLRAADYHDWAELHVDGAWRVLDAQKERWLAPADQYVAFRYHRDRAINEVGTGQRFRASAGLLVRY